MGDPVTTGDDFYTLSVAPNPFMAFITEPWDIELIRTRVVSVNPAIGESRVFYTVRNNLPRDVHFLRHAIYALPQP
jgi:hypothetical protein